MAQRDAVATVMDAALLETASLPPCRSAEYDRVAIRSEEGCSADSGAEVHHCPPARRVKSAIAGRQRAKRQPKHPFVDT